MEIDEIRIYSGCLEQGLDFKSYILEIDKNLIIKNIYPTKNRGAILEVDSILQKITKLKDFDIAITIISKKQEIPILMVEYSTAVPTDDHKMQRSDVYFWASLFKIPVLKISPLYNDSFKNHGGGNKITLLQEINLTIKQEAVVYFIDWKINNSLQLITNKERLSCIDYNKELYNILKNILEKLKRYTDFNMVYKNLLQEQMKYFNIKELKSLENNFVYSTRFQKIQEKIIVKINRFGHAMDPDRGILFFMNQLFGLENVITKFVIKRKNKIGSESYNALFDGLSENIKKQLDNLISKNFDEELVLEIFKIATGIKLNFKRVDSKRYKILDSDLIIFLKTYKSMSYKSIFINSCKLQLCDYNQNIICEISWNHEIIKNYLNGLNTGIGTPINLYPISLNTAKEDIITYASILLLNKIGCKILAVSYPDAQGDKPILVGHGRNTNRIYIDIIASIERKNYKESKEFKIFVFLQENKEKYISLKEDERKLLGLKNDNINCIDVLLKKLDFKHDFIKDDIYLGLGSKYAKNPMFLNVDYIFAFDVESNKINTVISWNIAVINFDLCNIFEPLINSENKLQGKILLDLIYKS